MTKYIKTLWRGFIILIKNYLDVVTEIEKQNLEYSRLKIGQNRSDTYDYLQRLVKLHIELFNSVWTVVLATISLIVSIIALIITIVK